MINTKSDRDYFIKNNKRLYEFGNFHKHPNLTGEGMVGTYVDGFNKGDMDWHGHRSAAIQHALCPDAIWLPINYHTTNGKTRIDKVLEFEKEYGVVDTMGASMSGYTYDHPWYNEVANRVFNLVSSGNDGPHTHNILAVQPKCCSIGALTVNHFGVIEQPIFSSWDEDADTEGKPVDLCTVGPAKVKFFADNSWHTDVYDGTSMRRPYAQAITMVNGQAFKIAEKKKPNHQEYNEMLFNFCFDVPMIMQALLKKYDHETSKLYYSSMVGFGALKLPSILLPHWATWYYSYLIDKHNMKPIRMIQDLSDNITRGQLAIMLAQIFCEYQHTAMASLAVRDYLNRDGIPFKGQIIDGVYGMNLESELTREEFFVMMRRVVEYLRGHNSGLDELSWIDNVIGSMMYLNNEGVKIFDKVNNLRKVDAGTACAILSRIMGYVEWSEIKYI